MNTHEIIRELSSLWIEYKSYIDKEYSDNSELASKRNDEFFKKTGEYGSFRAHREEPTIDGFFEWCYGENNNKEPITFNCDCGCVFKSNKYKEHHFSNVNSPMLTEIGEYDNCPKCGKFIYLFYRKK